MGSQTTRRVGIDLGTTYTCAAVADGEDVRIVQLETDSHAMPSVVARRDDGGFVAGVAAARRTVTDPTRVAREFKRRFGDAAPLVLGGQRTSPEELTRELLREVLARVTAVEGTAPGSVTLTHPAAWGPFRVEKLAEVAAEVGLDDVTLLPEPVAAAIANRDRLAPDAVVAVYDLGGGTFDAAVVHVGEGRVLGHPEGVERLGGLDIDALVMNHVDDTTGGMVTDVDIEDPDGRAGLARLADDCRQAKEALSVDAEADIPVMLPNVRTTVRLTRAELEAAVRPRLADTLVVLDRVVASAGREWEAIDAVLLVGGSSRMPLVGQLVAEHTGRPVISATNPALAIAMGAAAHRAAPVTAGAPAAAPAAAASVEPTPTPAPATAAAHAPGAPRRSRTPLLAGIGGVALIVAAIAYVAVGRGGDSSTTAPTTSAPTTSAPAATLATGTTGAPSTTRAGATGATAVSGATAAATGATGATGSGAAGAVTVGKASLRTDRCTIDPAVAKASALAIDGTNAVALVDGDAFLLDVDTTTCAMRLSTTKPGGRLVNGDTAFTEVSLRNGVVALSNGAGGTVVQLASGRAVDCPQLLDGINVTFDGTQVLSWRTGTKGYAILEFAGSSCNVKTPSVFNQIEVRGVAASADAAVLGVRRGAYSVVRVVGNNIVWEKGGTDDYSSIDGVSQCGTYYCVFDRTDARLTLVDANGDTVGRATLAQLGAADARDLLADQRAGWFLGQAPDGTTVVRRLTVA